MIPAALSGVILVATLALFASERVRHDLVALAALFACLLAGLVPVEEALLGFADPAVLTVAAVLVVGRAVELSGAAALVAAKLAPERAPFPVQLGAVLLTGAVLSAFMNNIAALVITMPIAAEVGRRTGRGPAATLMPLAFATILGGMTTLIGTPANLILSSVREDRLGEPFGFFQMSPVGTAVAAAGLAYMATLGWRLIPRRDAAEREAVRPWRVFELEVPHGATIAAGALAPGLRRAGARALALFRDGARQAPGATPAGGDRLLLLSRVARERVAGVLGLREPEDSWNDRGGRDEAEETARVVVAHGSLLEGQGYDAVLHRSDGELRVVAAGPRAARERKPLSTMRIRAGDQLYVRGAPAALARFAIRARLLEVDRHDPSLLRQGGRTAAAVGIFAAAIGAVVVGGVSTALAFLAAAALLAALRLLPSADVYRAIDWPIVVLLAAMIPVGRSFETSGAAALVAEVLGGVLGGAPLVPVIAALCALTLLLSMFLNNVATAIIMGPLAIDLAGLLGVDPDKLLLAVLIGASSDFLTPIGHQNNLLVMTPGGYRFTDYARVGALLTILVIGVTAFFLGLG
ncbi:MAG: TrkA-C domain protein [uncultured Sphingomonadaceae bacterium]|uniref:TrkA-C domain protein n=1 Tax=uncultured Sphingomonadaceae bacterium TaxID=169976 RepID=A0A6J4S8B4_9SPHN|nr:MAG: TrkA-C domain protein [uncultured Sphingomonadaceae bacterium]